MHADQCKQQQEKLRPLVRPQQCSKWLVAAPSGPRGLKAYCSVKLRSSTHVSGSIGCICRKQHQPHFWRPIYRSPLLFTTRGITCCCRVQRAQDRHNDGRRAGRSECARMSSASKIVTLLSLSLTHSSSSNSRQHYGFLLAIWSTRPQWLTTRMPHLNSSAP